MIRLRERKPLPQRCKDCQEVKEFGIDAACAECDYCLERFEITREEEKESE